jgi:polyhydroxyalkanoate synthesis regulator phasin
MRHRLFTLITKARQDLQEAEQMAKAEVVHDMDDDDTARERFEARARLHALEARVAAIEERSKE